MSRRIIAVLPGSTGGVASALITGKRGAISEQVKEAFRQSGLQHLLAIAGLHLGLVGGFRLFHGARPAGADPVRGIALSDQEDRGGRHPRSARLLSDAVGSSDPDRARFCHERARVCRDPDRPAEDFDADLRARRRLCACVRTRKPGRRQLSDVVWRGRGADCGLRDVWPAARPIAASPVIAGARAGLCRGGSGDDRRRHDRHRSVLGLSLPSRGALFAAGQCRRGAAERGLDLAVGCGRLPLDAVRPRAVRAGSDGLGDRRHDLCRAARLGPARQCLADAATARRGAGAGRARRVVALPVAPGMAALGCGRDQPPASSA